MFLLQTNLFNRISEIVVDIDCIYFPYSCHRKHDLVLSSEH